MTPLRQRFIEDMQLRGLRIEKAQRQNPRLQNQALTGPRVQQQTPNFGARSPSHPVASQTALTDAEERGRIYYVPNRKPSRVANQAGWT